MVTFFKLSEEKLIAATRFDRVTSGLLSHDYGPRALPLRHAAVYFVSGLCIKYGWQLVLPVTVMLFPKLSLALSIIPHHGDF